MTARMLIPPGLAVLAALSAGCAGIRPKLAGPPPAGAADYAARTKAGFPPADPRQAAAEPHPLQGSSYGPGGPAAKPPADPRAGMNPSGVTPVSAQAPGPLAPPVNLPPAGPPGQPPQPGPTAGGPGQPPTPPPDWSGAGMAPYGPHVRETPTATGARLGLGPQDVPAERVVELSTQLQAAAFENKALIARIRELDAVAHGREVSLVEAVREVEAASGEVAKARAELAALRAEVAAARDRLRQIEKEDVETLRAVIAGLEKLLQAPPARPTAGREP